MPNPFALPDGMALFTFHGRVVRGKRLGSRLGFTDESLCLHHLLFLDWNHVGQYASDLGQYYKNQ